MQERSSERSKETSVKERTAFNAKMQTYNIKIRTKQLKHIAVQRHSVGLNKSVYLINKKGVRPRTLAAEAFFL